MEPQIQYCKTSDGVSIAYWTLGEGVPLILLAPFIYSHIGLEWEMPDLQAWYEHLAGRRLLVRFDPRNNGLSQRGVQDFSLETQVSDLAAVVDATTSTQFELMGFGGSAPAAIAFAGQFPERVLRLILFSPMARTSEVLDRPEFKAIEPLLDTDWRVYTEAMAHQTLGWGRGRAAHDWARFIRRAVTGDDIKRFLAARSDATQFLQRVQAPALLLAWKGYPPEAAQEVASQIAHARLVRTKATLPHLDPEATRAIDEFLAEGDPAFDQASAAPTGTAVILFADIADSTALTERLGDVAFRDKARELDEALRRAIASNGGTAIEGKVLGDGVLATFGAAREAIACAAAIHDAGSHAGLPLHIGIHAGDVIREANNVYGGAVNIASRVAGEARAGETLVSDIVRGLAKTSAGVSFEDRGEHTLKGVGGPVRLYEVRWRGET